jgi:hypothetical protein
LSKKTKQLDVSGAPVQEKEYLVGTPHLDKLNAALSNPKCRGDVPLIKAAIKQYNKWIENLGKLTSEGKERVEEMTDLLNWYKNELEVELIMKRGSDFLKRQKGQLKLDSSVLEEFLIHLVHPDILNGLDDLEQLVIGPQEAFMSLAFLPRSIKELGTKPRVVLKTKDQDFVIGTKIHYKFASDGNFQMENTSEGSFTLSVLAAECKINLDKTMYQEAAGTAARLKQGCPMSKYFVLVEFLDMEPEDCRLTAIDNVFILRHTHRLPFEKRDVVKEVEQQHQKFPIDSELIWRFVQEIQAFVSTIWFDPEEILKKGSFI